MLQFAFYIGFEKINQDGVPEDTLPDVPDEEGPGPNGAGQAERREGAPRPAPTQDMVCTAFVAYLYGGLSST